MRIGTVPASRSWWSPHEPPTLTASHTVEIQCRDMVHAGRGLSVRIFLEGEPRVFCSHSMRDGTTHPSRSVLSVFLEKLEPLRLGSSSRFSTARGNRNWECPQRA